MGDIPLDAANFFGILLSVWLYALFQRVFLASLWPLWRRRHVSGGRFVVAVTLCLFVTATSQIAINIAKCYNRFVTYRGVPDTEAYAENAFMLKATLSSWLFMFAIWNAEIILVWRVWVVWSRDWRAVLFPIIMFLTEFVAGVVTCIRLGPREAFVGHKNDQATEKIIAGVSLLLVNSTCTPLVIFKLWRVGRHVQIQQTRTLYQTIVFRLIESGSLYSATSLLWIIFMLPSGSAYPGISTLFDYVFQMVVAISPMMIFSHVAQKAEPKMREIVVVSSDPVRQDKCSPHQPVNMRPISTTIAFRTPSSPSGSFGDPLKSGLSCTKTEPGVWPSTQQTESGLGAAV
ncbi:hypothetical protein FRB93_002596 [Tulasnella sp. JGI-2019a]|nr:hypothetical protein FRB93_002596 [Tulasnella sp. JGI-2019a]